jgi:hypothetical protein
METVLEELNEGVIIADERHRILSLHHIHAVFAGSLLAARVRRDDIKP